MVNKNNSAYVSTLKVYNNYFKDITYQFSFLDNTLNLNIDKKDVDKFILYKRNTTQRSNAFSNITKILEDKSNAIRISSNRLAVFQLKEMDINLIIIFEVNGDDLRFINIDCKGNFLDKKDYIDILKRINHAHEFKLKQKTRTI